MNEAAIHECLKELADILTRSPVPEGSASAPVAGLYVPSSGQRHSVDDCLDHLRVLVKYVAFDLEATRRENRYLRQMLESRSKQDVEDGPEDNST